MFPQSSRASTSDDGTTKLLVGMPDGERVETVLIPQLDDPSIVTQCISSQVGCAMGCVFCASGLDGVQRNLSTGEVEIDGPVLIEFQVVDEENVYPMVPSGGSISEMLRRPQERRGISVDCEVDAPNPTEEPA